MATSTLTVSGMTCEHCERAVESELSALDGVTAAKASATAGTVTIDAEPIPDVALLREAVEEAGYELTGS